MADTPAARQSWDLLFALFRRHRAHMRGLQERFDLTPMDLHAMRALTPGTAMPAGQLAQRIHCDPPNVVKVIGRLTERGLVTRVRDERDARMRPVRLSAEGERQHAAIARALGTPPDYITLLDEDDQRALRDLLEKMLGAAQRQPPGGCASADQIT